MEKTARKPGDLLKMFREGGAKRRIAMKAAGIKHAGTSHGKSNRLGHGGRAAQLTSKLRKQHLPGGEREVKAIVGIQARRAHAAPGQKNFHGTRTKHATRRKGATEMHHHFHVHGKGIVHVHMKGGNVSHGTKDVEPTVTGAGLEKRQESKHQFKRKAAKRNSSHGKKLMEPTTQGTNLEKEEEGKKEFKGKKRHKGAMCMKCKGAHATKEHGKKNLK